MVLAPIRFGRRLLVSLPLGFAAISNRFIYEINGHSKNFVLNDRLLVGSPGIGSKAYGRVYFKDIEVFVPDKDSIPAKPSPFLNRSALKDFFKDVPGRWVPVLRSEKDLAGCRIIPPGNAPTSPGKVAFQSDALEIYNRHVELSAFNSSAQGIRAKVKWIKPGRRGTIAAGRSGNAYLRHGVLLPRRHETGMWLALTQNGKWGTFGIVVTGGAVPRTTDGFAVIGFAAIGDTFVCEINGDSRCKMRDKRITFAVPRIGVSDFDGHAFFRDIEVFVPDKKADAIPITPAPKTDEITTGIGAVLVRIKPGQYYMGSPPDDPSHLSVEDRHDVRISKPFYIGKCEITQEQYRAVMGTNPSSFCATGENSAPVEKTDTRRYPVECVSWDDAQKFCEKLSAREHRRYRLPTEAEWEYCCRGGTDTPYSFGQGITKNNVNMNDFYAGPWRVGVFPENKWGLCDMHGNVAEWCQDYYSATYYKESPTNDPTGPATGVNRVVRGGSWNTVASRRRSAARSSDPPTTRRDDLGFRIVTE